MPGANSRGVIGRILIDGALLLVEFYPRKADVRPEMGRLR